MIMRSWRGATRKSAAESYVEYMRETGLKEYLQTEGNRGALLLRRDEGDTTEFLFLSLWDSVDAIRRFAGDEYELAVYYPDDDDFLVERDLHVDHYQVAIDELGRDSANP